METTAMETTAMETRVKILLKHRKVVVAVAAVVAAKPVVDRTDVDTVADIPAVRDAQCQTRAGLNSRLLVTHGRLC